MVREKSPVSNFLPASRRLLPASSSAVPLTDAFAVEKSIAAARQQNARITAELAAKETRHREIGARWKVHQERLQGSVGMLRREVRSLRETQKRLIEVVSRQMLVEQGRENTNLATSSDGRESPTSLSVFVDLDQICSPSPVSGSGAAQPNGDWYRALSGHLGSSSSSSSHAGETSEKASVTKASIVHSLISSSATEEEDSYFAPDVELGDELVGYADDEEELQGEAWLAKAEKEMMDALRDDPALRYQIETRALYEDRGS